MCCMILILITNAKASPRHVLFFPEATSFDDLNHYQNKISQALSFVGVCMIISVQHPNFLGEVPGLSRSLCGLQRCRRGQWPLTTLAGCRVLVVALRGDNGSC